VCIDFRDLNKATSIDGYPMLVADALVNVADKPMFCLNYATIFVYECAFTFKSWYETLVAWSLGVYVLLLVC
jgi:hypothetical protein